MALAAFACGGSKANDNKDSGSVKFNQYYLQGSALYEANCSNCHQKDGSGLKLVYPPLNTSDYMEANFNDVICLMRNGKREAVVVNGKTFTQPMPENKNLTNLEIAEIATYIYNTWSHAKGIVEVKDVSGVLEGCR